MSRYPTIQERKANEKWVLQIKSTTRLWTWIDNANVYYMSGNKIVPANLKGYVELAGIVRKQFMKALVAFPNDSIINEEMAWEIIDEITPTK